MIVLICDHYHFWQYLPHFLLHQFLSINFGFQIYENPFYEGWCVIYSPKMPYLTIFMVSLDVFYW